MTINTENVTILIKSHSYINSVFICYSYGLIRAEFMQHIKH